MKRLLLLATLGVLLGYPTGISGAQASATARSAAGKVAASPQ